MTLQEDGTVSGAFSGTWSEKEGTPYATITLDGKTYTGVFVRQTISKNNYFYEKDYKVVVMPPQGNEKLLLASYFTDTSVDASKGIDGSISMRNPFYQGTTQGLDISNGVEIDFEVVPNGDLHALGTLISFVGSGRLYFTPASYLGYNATGGYFDANMKDYACVTDYIGEAYAKTKEPVEVKLLLDNSGFEVYVDDTMVYDETILSTENGSGDLSNYKKMMTWLQSSATTLYVGYGSWWTQLHLMRRMT